jgi:hypothetical protein
MTMPSTQQELQTPALQDQKKIPFTMPNQVIYADQIINIGVGMSVTRLTLATEVGEGLISPFAQLVMPTPALLDALSPITDALMNNEAIRKNVVDALDALREKLMKQNGSP